MKRHFTIMAVLLILAGASLFAQSEEKDVKVLDLNEAGKDKLKLGVSLGYPEFGLVGGWQVSRSLEADLFLGSLNYNAFCLGGSAMFSLIDVEIGTEIFPVTVGPFVNVALGPHDTVLSLGGKARMEYTFDFSLNLYLESGLAINLGDSDNPWGIPVSLGVRYVF